MQSLGTLTAITTIIGSLIIPNGNENNDSKVEDVDSITPTIQMDEVEVISTVKENTVMRQLPSAVNMVSRRQLEANNVNSIKGVATMVPNFFMPDYGSRLTSAIYIRGIGSRINTPAVGMYVDNVPYVDKSAFDFNFFDIERVDVLRGPQGTLYGRNAMGGIIRVYTKNPFSYEGTDVNLGYASGDNHRRTSITHYHRWSDKFAFSAGGYYEGGDGFFRNDFTGKKSDKMQAGGGRIRGIYKHSNKMNFDFNVSYDYSDEGAYPYYYTGSLTDPTYMTESIDKITNNRESKYRRGMLNAGVNVEYKAPRFVMNAITGYQYLNDRMFMDQDFLSTDIYTLEQKQRINTISEEITFKDRNNDGRWHWVSGINAMYQTLHTEAPVTFYSDGLRWLEGNINSNMPDIQNNEKMSVMKGMGFTSMGVNFRGDELRMSGEYDTPTLSLALFHQSTFDITDHLSLTAGLRVGYDMMKADFYSPANVDYGFSMPNTMFGYMNLDIQNLTSSILYDGTLKNNHSVVLPKFAVKYDLGKHGNIYASASMGQRAGGYNLQMFSDLLQGKLRVNMMDGIKEGVVNYLTDLRKEKPNMPDFVPGFVKDKMDENMPQFQTPAAEQIMYKPEYSWNYELGTHLNLAERKLQLDAAMFLIDVRDQQIARFAPSGLGRMMVNAGKSRSYGAELTALWRPNAHWAFMTNYGFTHAKFTEYNAGDGADYTGNYVPFVPKHTLHVDASHTWLISETRWLRTISLGANCRMAGPIYWTEANDARQDTYYTLGARLAFETEHATIQLWGKNLTDQKYNTFYFISVNRGYEQHCKPIQFGVDIKVKF